MKMFRMNKILGMLCLTGLFLFPSCHSTYRLVNVQGSKVEMTNAYEAAPDSAAVAVLAPFKFKVDSIMSPVIGTSELDMKPGSPESLLSNLVADVLWTYSNSIPGETIDVSVINLGGLRSNLPKGVITFGTIYEILPFENALCILSMKGSDLRSLFKEIAKVGGQGVSHVKLLLSDSRNAELLEAKVGGKEIEDDKIYKVATIDYLAEGNDGLTSFLKAEKRVCPEGATIRKIFLEYVKGKTAKGETITSELDGRIQINNKK
jgi:2',3'-cyclic-nucleotide 2'-phosphodiesterase (5'-nucleotidase family)